MTDQFNPSQVLRLRPEFFDGVRQGKKRSTIRAGRRNFKAGPLILRSKFDTLTVELTEVIYKKFGELAQDDAYADGFATLEDLQKTLKRFYPNTPPPRPRTPPESVKLSGTSTASPAAPTDYNHHF